MSDVFYRLEYTQNGHEHSVDCFIGRIFQARSGVLLSCEEYPKDTERFEYFGYLVLPELLPSRPQILVQTGSTLKTQGSWFCKKL